MKAPSERARLVLARYKQAAALGADEKARLANVLQERALRGDLSRFDIRPGTLSVPKATLAHRLWASTFVKLGLGLVALGSAGGVAYQMRGGAPASALDAPAVTVTRPPREASAAPEVGPATSRAAEPAPSDGDAATKTPAAPPSQRPRSDRGPSAPSAGASEPTIDEEVRLVNGAQAALRAGDSRRALELLNEHAARFPSGKLATLRQVTHMLALCQSGRAPQARQEAASFLAKSPSSPFAERVSRICSDDK